ncbi:hypothetical protein [Marinoscillum furvescens]|nr:hypothetical protein [Marinoscillum furvescens]
MDELKDLWKEVNIANADAEKQTSDVIHGNAVKRSSAPMEKLLRGIRSKAYFAIAFALVFGAIIPIAMPVVSQYLLIILFAAYVSGSILLFQEYRILKAGIDMTQNVRTSVKNYKKRIEKVLRYEEHVALCLYPVCAASGFLLGFQWMAGEQPILNSTKSWIIFGVVILVSTVVGYFLARYLNKKAFGPYLKQLEENLSELVEE